MVLSFLGYLKLIPLTSIPSLILKILVFLKLEIESFFSRTETISLSGYLYKINNK